MKRILICGGRNEVMSSRHKFLSAMEIIDAVVERAGGPLNVVIIEGGAPGADFAGWVWALMRGADHQVYEADWGNIDVPGAVVKTNQSGGKYNAAAGGVRNQRMIDEGKPDLCLAFPGDTGTADMIRRCKKANVPVKEIK